MTNDMKALYSLVHHANAVFQKCHEKPDTSIRVMEEKNAVFIDCVSPQLRLVLLTIDRLPGVVGIGIGTRGADQEEILEECQMDALTSTHILEIMEKHFVQESK